MNPSEASRIQPRIALAAALSLVLSACATHPAPGLRGSWKPVNRYSPAPQEIPLRTAYVYYATPMDRTLKTMLERWARDTHMKLDYQHGSDFTLYAPVAQLRTDDLRAAVDQLNTLYAPQQVSLAVEGDRIVVRRPAPASN